MSKKKLVISGIVLAVGLSLLFIPVKQRRVLTEGTDQYEAHHPLFENRTISQAAVLQGTVSEIGAILVNFKRAETLTPVNVIVRSVAGEPLAHATIPANMIHDDEFAFGALDQPVAASTIEVQFSSREATSQNVIGLRFDKDTQTVAMAVVEAVPLHKKIVTIVRDNPRSALLSTAVGVALLIVLATVLPIYLAQRSFFSAAGWAKVAAIAVLCLTALILRLHITEQLKGVSGGDPYNYLFITKNIAQLRNPFEGVKRLPGYPLLLLPAYTTSIDDIRFMQLSSIAASVGIIITLFALAARLGLPWPVQLMTAVAVAFQKDFLWASIRPEPYTLYALLLLVSTWLFFYLKNYKLQLLFGVLLGYSAMVRQEGFVLALFLGVATLFQWRYLGWKGYIRIFLPAFLIVLPFFIHNTRVYGNPLFTPYFEGERLQIVNSWESFKDNLGATWGIMSSLWRPRWDELHRVELADRWFLLGFIGTLVLWCVRSFIRVPQSVLRGSVVLAGSVALALLSVAFIGKGVVGDIVMRTSAGILLASAIPFIHRTRWKGIVIVVVALTQILIATWFHPFPKHYQQAYPLIVLILITALLAPNPHQKKEASSLWALSRLAGTTTAIAVPLSIIFFFLFKQLHIHIDEVNEHTALDSVVYRAVTRARALHPPHGFDQAYLPARLYFGDNLLFFGDDSSASTIEKQKQWLADNHVKTLVITNAEPLFDAKHQWGELIATFKSEGKKERLFQSWVYSLP